MGSTTEAAAAAAGFSLYPREKSSSLSLSLSLSPLGRMALVKALCYSPPSLHSSTIPCAVG
jgi:hypothetical protein